MDTLQELKRQRGVVAQNIVANIQLPVSDGLPVYHESDFEKALSEGTIEVFSVEKVSQFTRNLMKAEADANGDATLLEEIEKAKKDITKLVKVKKQDKRGRMTTVYVRAHSPEKTGETIKMHPADSAGAVAQTKDGKDVPLTINHKTLGTLSHHSSVSKEDGTHHHYHDKDGLRHTFVEDHKKDEEPKQHKDMGKIHPVDWDGPSKVKVVGADDKHVHVKRVGKDGKELEGDEHNMSYSHDEWKIEKQSGKALHNQDPKAFGDEPSEKQKAKAETDKKIADNKKYFDFMQKLEELDDHEFDSLGLGDKGYFNFTEEDKKKIEDAHAGMEAKYQHNGVKLTKSEARRLKHLADTDPKKAHKEAKQYSDSYAKAEPDQKMFGQPVSEIKAEYDAVADYAKGKLDNKKVFDKEFNDGVREWSGDEYTDDMIASVAEGYGEPDSFEGDLAGFAKMVSHATSQSSQSRQVHSAVDDLFAEIQPNNWHKDLDEQGVKDILWGMIMQKLNSKK